MEQIQLIEAKKALHLWWGRMRILDNKYEGPTEEAQASFEYLELAHAHNHLLSELWIATGIDKETFKTSVLMAMEKLIENTERVPHILDDQLADNILELSIGYSAAVTAKRHQMEGTSPN